MTTSVYIHIPFCNHLCTYCDFAKMYYYEDIASKYLDALELEIKNNYQGELIKTIYIGGGTPSSLSLSNLKRLMQIIKIFKKDKICEFTFEVNPENIDKEKLLLLKENNVTRISIGIESTQDKFLKYLGRCHDFNLVKEKIELMKKLNFSNINVDLIYALPNETIKDLQKDLERIISLNINHISCYSLEIHHNTILGIKKEKNISEDLDREMYDFICNYLTKHHYTHYEISNFAKDNSYSHHNLTYWHNEEYYGFGLGASGYVNDIRYTNTRSMKDKIHLQDKISYALILGFRLINGINKEEFKKKYQEELLDTFNIRELINLHYLIDDGLNIKISYDKIYIENTILENFIN